jgi:hypothetical protein
VREIPVLLLICTLSPAAAGTWPKMLPVVDCAKEGALANARLAATAAASVRNGNAKLFFMLGGLSLSHREQAVVVRAKWGGFASGLPG